MQEPEEPHGVPKGVVNAQAPDKVQKGKKRGWKENTEENSLALYVDNRGIIPATTYGPLSTGSDP